MPVRSYGCPKCEYQWDQLVGVNDDADTCPNCGCKEDIKKLITGTPSLRTAPREWDKKENKWKQKNAITDRHSTQLDFGYKPIEKSRVKDDMGMPVPVYTEWEKEAKIIKKVEFDTREEEIKEKERVKKEQGKGSTIIYSNKPSK